MDTEKPPITLNDFYDFVVEQLENFDFNWQRLSKADPETYPIQMTKEEWMATLDEFCFEWSEEDEDEEEDEALDESESSDTNEDALDFLDAGDLVEEEE